MIERLSTLPPATVLILLLPVSLIVLGAVASATRRTGGGLAPPAPSSPETPAPTHAVHRPSKLEAEVEDLTRQVRHLEFYCEDIANSRNSVLARMHVLERRLQQLERQQALKPDQGSPGSKPDSGPADD